MLIMLLAFACETPETYFYDISSTVIITDKNEQLVEIEELTLCQRFRSEDTDTTTDWTVHAEQCVAVSVTDGIAVLPNWEGEYFGTSATIVVETVINGETYGAELIDSDTEVWCDNAVAIAVDEHNNVTEYGDLCSENFERYLLWSLVIPTSELVE
ncbi:MAG: hypothetical protein VXZ96_17200 [Myxococcota bacterium]|nr:hypothetical protein [Myxococcota bacterium]